MPCHPFRSDDGKVSGFVCTRGASSRCASCGRAASKLCDWKLAGEKAGKTCDRPLCANCARSPAPGKDLCPAHWRAWERMEAPDAR